MRTRGGADGLRKPLHRRLRMFSHASQCGSQTRLVENDWLPTLATLLRHRAEPRGEGSGSVQLSTAVIAAVPTAGPSAKPRGSR
jgi:hypothetical protein